MATRPDPLPMTDVMQGSNVLAQLRFQLAQSQQRLDCIAALVPAALHRHLQPSSIDNGVWYVLCPNAAALSKMRQLQPRLLAHLKAQGLYTKDIVFRVTQPRAAGGRV